jgi:uncharacterized protein (TIGR00255 family)
MESMTGYAHVEDSTAQFSFTVELKSLNSKFLEIYVNTPKILSKEEFAINELLKERFGRGKVELSIDIYDWAESREMSVDAQLMDRYYKILSSFRKKVKAAESFSLDALLTLDGVVQRSRSTISSQSLSSIRKAVDAVIKQAITMRRSEGKALEQELLSCVTTIEENLADIKKASVLSTRDRYEKLRERIEKIGVSTVDETRLYSDVALYADRVDINEEITRLTDHIRKFRQAAKEKDQIGKKLDFIAQEMFREANTIGSKTPSTEVSHLAVNVKNNIEKIREQCRNVV